MKNLISLGLKLESGRLLVLDQTELPHVESWLECRSPEDMDQMIRRLAVRGAPLIGIAAALSLAHFAEKGATLDQIRTAAQLLRRSRPTAVNLMAAIDRVVLDQLPDLEPDLGSHQNASKQNAQAILEKIIDMAVKFFEEDVLLCRQMAGRAALLIEDGDAILTHCNTGGLVTAGIGTALGAIRHAHESGKRIHVFVDETRPLLQGARLTTWELKKLGIPHTLICDNMAGFLMSQGKVKKVFVGADRIAFNGDFANKIGTYAVAVLAKHHGVPFYVVAPHTTLDLNCPSKKEIPIEERNFDEVRAGRAPQDTHVWNPGFDVTPRELISGIVLDDRMM